MTGRGETAGGWSADDYAQHARFVADQAADLIDWLAPVSGERILDLGCGDGAMSARIAARGARVIGLDSSPDFVAAARERGIDAVVGDAQALDACRALGWDYDAVFSNAALHWMRRDPEAVIAGVYRRLAPGGRFVAEFGGEGNIVPIHEALRAELEACGLDPDRHDPWFFPEKETYIDQLRASGFSIEKQSFFERPTPLPSDIGDWLATLARPFVYAFNGGAERADYIDAVRQRVAPELQNDDGDWTAPYVRLRFVARKPIKAL